MNSFLYCFDANYNIQATISMLSLLDNVENKLNIYIIHDQPESFEKYLKKIKKNNNLNSIEIYKFEDKKHNFPNLHNSHVTYATYFRVFIDNYLPQDIDFLTYVDADILCLQNPEQKIKEVVESLKSKGVALAGLTEGERKTSEEFFINLGLKNDRYFNAGLIVIDYKQWQKLNLTKSLLGIMNNNYKNIIYWDQDLMNLFFDGQYLELPRELNYTPSESIYAEKLPSDINICFLHYSGSKKPWYFENVFLSLSRYYQEAYKKYFANQYHATAKFKKHEVAPLLSILKSPDINSVDKFKLIYGIIKTNFYLNEK